MSCAYYLKNAFKDREKHLRFAVKELKEIKFDTIVCTGISGIMFASPLALKLKKSIVVVRKGKDGSHSANPIESSVKIRDIGRWVFVDDLVDSGKTFDRVKKALRDEVKREERIHACKIPITYMGRYLYEWSEFTHA